MNRRVTSGSSIEPTMFSCPLLEGVAEDFRLVKIGGAHCGSVVSSTEFD